MLTGIVACVSLVVIVVYIKHRRQLTIWREDVESIKEELTPERRHAVAAFEHYFEFKPLPEDQRWMLSHGLIEAGRRGKVMLSSKGLYVLRCLGFSVY